MKSALTTAGRVIVLTIILFICFAAASRVLVQPGGAQTAEAAGAAAARLLVVCALDTLVLTYIILRSRWGGWRLVATVFVVFYGVATFMPQIESAVFITVLPPGMLPRLFLMGALIAAPFALVAVPILGRWKADTAGTEPDTRLVMTPGEWTGRLTIIVLAYLVLYFTFGYFIAWRNPAVRAYYGGIDEGSFLAHMGAVLRDTWWLIPFQGLRALLWTAIALPVVRMMKGTWAETALAVGLLFAVVMNAQLLLPNPYMSAVVRGAHLVETASSNFIFGWLAGALLARPADAHRVGPLTAA